MSEGRRVKPIIIIRSLIDVVCEECEGPILKDAYAQWSVDNQEWELATDFDSFYCPECDGHTKHAKEIIVCQTT